MRRGGTRANFPGRKRLRVLRAEIRACRMQPDAGLLRELAALEISTRWRRGRIAPEAAR